MRVIRNDVPDTSPRLCGIGLPRGTARKRKKGCINQAEKVIHEPKPRTYIPKALIQKGSKIGRPSAKTTTKNAQNHKTFKKPF